MALWELRPRQPLLGIALAAVIGIALADRFPVPFSPLALSAVVGAAFVLWRPRALACWVVAGLLFAALHLVRHHGHPARALAAVLESGPRVVQARGLVVDEPQLPSIWMPGVSCFFRLRLDELAGPGLPAARGVAVTVAWAGRPPRYGDVLEFTGSARNLEPRRNPGQFDFTAHQQRQGIFSEIAVRHASDGRLVAENRGSILQAFALRSRAWIQRQLARDLEDFPEITALISSMVLGLRGETPEDARELFQRTGTLHLFAVSGLNVAMLAGILLVLFRTLRLGQNAAILATVPLLAFYALVTGLSASCVRATIMGSLVLMAPLFDRRAVPVNSICAAAVLILAWDTNQLFLPGFQFSFVLVLAIIFLAPRLQRRLEPCGAPDPFIPRVLWTRAQQMRFGLWRFAAGTLGVTIAAWVGSLVFTAGYFHLFSPAALLANLFAVPLAFVILALGVASLLASPLLPSAAALLNNANWLAARALLGLVKIFAAVPGGHVYVELPAPGPRPLAEITVLDLAEGAATHVRIGERDWLFDCGSGPRYATTVLPYLRTRGIDRLDGLLLTHGDAQHLGGAVPLLDDFAPRAIFESPLRDRSTARAALAGALAAASRGKAITGRGDFIRLHPAGTLRVLFPPAGLRRSLADDKAIVVRLDVAGRRILFLSDSGFSTEQWLLENEPDLRADVLVKGTHARDLSGTPDFLRRVAPQAIVAGRSELRRAAEATDELDSSAAAAGAALFRQDRTGAVRIVIARDGTLELRAFLGGQTFRSRAR